MGALHTLQELDALQDAMNKALDAIRAEIDVHDLPDLSNYATEPHPLDDAHFICPPRLYEARKLALATIGQIRNLIQRPYERVVEQSTAVYETACLDILVKTGILDKLADEEHANGMHALELERAFDIDSVKLMTVLRYLAAQGWLHEPDERVFALTRLALELRQGNNGRKWIMTPGKPTVATSLLDQLTHPDREWRYSRKPDETAFQLGNNTKLTLFEHLKRNPDELTQWASSVQSLGDAYHSAIINDYPWRELQSRSFVDCGGGQGNLSISLAELLPEAQFIVQDLEEVVPIAKANIARRLTDPAKRSRITVEPHNFFEVQPRGGDRIYMLRYILHDWPDHACIKILKNIAQAAGPKAKIIIVEVISVPCTTSAYAQYRGHPVTLDDLRGAKRHQAITPPAYIPENFGACAKMSLALGVHMMGVFNALERSMTEWFDLITRAGLQISRVQGLRGMVSIIECEVARQ
ncbi:hypothetical protein BOTBODRAFT_55853 [Botryobasidium botryosum FD-172 SS1]|uniref:O-methyltransferase C-terminal domain-containing protein n=1 Tax=Botryobasidium botryosum (strain FD-172 SS1) TaxID=930990 RepID=A0A067MGP3_BOTB1|nr:hypothetical protein BOTBODRAFT_55853 [Botryobasidium botryosum FD-172 SS1]